MTLGERLKALREDQDIYQKEVAAYLHVSIGTISNYEQDIHKPDVDTLCRLAEFFGVTTDYLLGYRRREVAAGLELEDILMLPEHDRLLIARLAKRLKDGPC